MQIRLGIAGATGAVGRIVCDRLADFNLGIAETRLLASARSVNRQISLGNQLHTVALLSRENIEGLDLVIASTPDDVALEIASWCQELGITLIDESASLRMLDHVPLVIPEVNSQHAKLHQGLIASPNCSTTQLVMCLKPLHDFATIKRVIVSTYQAASGAGSLGENELIEATKAKLEDRPFQPQTFSKLLAFNLIPQIGRALSSGYTSEEQKMVDETRKILDTPNLAVNATCVRVPVICGHSESITVECENSIDAEKATRLFQQMPGLSVVDNLEQGEFPTPLQCCGSDQVFVGRVRDDLAHKNCISFWCVSDNLRKGAATNALQIAKLLIDNNWLS